MATKEKKRALIRFLILIIFIITALAAAQLFDLEVYMDVESLRLWISGYGIWGPLIFIAFYLIAPTFMLPGLPITVLSGLLFGPIFGIIYASIGATLGASLAFIVARQMGRDWVESFIKIKHGRWEKLDKEVELRGWQIVAFARLIPLFPFNLLNYAFGLTKIRFSHYFIASFIFMLPGVAAYVLFSSSFLELFRGRVTKEFLLGTILIIILSLIPLLYKISRKRQR
jgi:uncharacterized membrane protein YdjX (TVP38/TMEM64 family)